MLNLTVDQIEELHDIEKEAKEIKSLHETSETHDGRIMYDLADNCLTLISWIRDKETHG